MRLKFHKRIAPNLAPLALALIALCPTHNSRIAYGETLGAPRTNTTVRIGILGLFHPHTFMVTAPLGHAIVLRTGAESFVLEDPGIRRATMHLSGNGITVSFGSTKLHAAEVEVADRKNEAVDFTLTIPGKIARGYHGTLTIRPSSGDLLAIVTLDLETAVASVVSAESGPDTPPEALKALAIASRSYFVSGRGRHSAFDFCDTTHCQFLRAAPGPRDAVAQAAEATRGLVLAYRSQPFAAMYTRSCSGRTRTPLELGISQSNYPYYSVECRHCRMQPVRWTSRISIEDAAALQPRTESARLTVAHRLGWAAVPSNDFSFESDGDRVVLRGLGNGHGIGLCQAGAKAMATSGSSFREILDHYYPNTTLISLFDSQPSGLAMTPQR